AYSGPKQAAPNGPGHQDKPKSKCLFSSLKNRILQSIRESFKRDRTLEQTTAMTIATFEKLTPT
ncbi:MAG: hypothetical protein VCE74_22430, partial [Alphaproteobacteria bacterium]